ncbi:glycosyltransferase family 2 protein [Candidatus Saccharibacteria bacterium]|nr:glycosyltransferase family 2 protein [Candidatus Saccharibacteria bacterium]
MHIAKVTPPQHRREVVDDRPTSDYASRRTLTQETFIAELVQRLSMYDVRRSNTIQLRPTAVTTRSFETEQRETIGHFHRLARYETRANILMPDGAYLPAHTHQNLPTLSVALHGNSMAKDYVEPILAKLEVAEPEQLAADHVSKRKLALLLPGHNEEVIIASTIRSAVAAGQALEDIYVVDDDSSDNTRSIAVNLLGEDHVLTVERSGKAGAVHQAVEHFAIVSSYEWLHVADADSIFSPQYFDIYRSKLDSDRYAIAIGFVQSLRGNWISSYRAVCYTYGQQVFRRIHAKLKMISVFPGPVTSFRTDILPLLEMHDHSLTEDFDITLQVHRKKLGGMLYIPRAINYTQDPQTLRDFSKQSLRWFRGFFQGIRDYKVGLGKQRIDFMIAFQLFQTVLFVLAMCIIVPIYVALSGNWQYILALIALDYIINSATVLFSAAVTRRWQLLAVLPYLYILRNLELLLFFRAAVEVLVLGLFSSNKQKGWATEGRRYQLNSIALQDTAL